MFGRKKKRKILYMRYKAKLPALPSHTKNNKAPKTTTNFQTNVFVNTQQHLIMHSNVRFPTCGPCDNQEDIDGDSGQEIITKDTMVLSGKQYIREACHFVNCGNKYCSICRDECNVFCTLFRKPYRVAKQQKYDTS